MTVTAAPTHNNRKPRSKVDVLRNAQEVLQRQGWTKNILQDQKDKYDTMYSLPETGELPPSNGPVCLSGALILGVVNSGVTDMDVAEATMNQKEASIKLFRSTEIFLNGVIFEYEMARDVSNYLAQFYEPLPTSVSVPGWNDFELTTQEQVMTVLETAINKLSRGRKEN